MSGLVVSDPVTLTAVLASNRMVPGDVIKLRGMTYTGNFTNALIGTAAKPIIIRPYEGEHVVIDGNFADASQHTLIDGDHRIEFRYSGWSARNYVYDVGVGLAGPGCKIRNCWIHDITGSGMNAYNIQGEFYGCVISNVGYILGTTGHGHGLYVQNQSALRQTIKHNIILYSYGFNIHAYTEGGYIDYQDMIENILVDANHDGILIGALNGPAHDPHLIGNMSYGNRTGYANAYHGSLLMDAENNYFPDGWLIDNTTFATNSGNITAPEETNKVFVIPNIYKATAANIAVYNWEGLDSVEVDLTPVTGLTVGDSVAVHNAANFLADIQTLTLDVNKKISINMQIANRTIAQRIAGDTPATTFPTFGAFVVIK